MFCGGTKKPKDDKNKSKSVLEPDLSGLCKIHKKPYDSICIDTNWNGQLRACATCREQLQQQKIQTIGYFQLVQLIQDSKFDDMVVELGKIKRDWDKEIRQKAKDQISKIKEITQNILHNMIFEFLIGGDKQSNLSKQEWAWIVDSDIITEFENLNTQNSTIQKMQNEQALYLLGKLFNNNTDIQLITNGLNKDFNELQQKINSVQKDIDIKIENFNKSINQISKKTETIKQQALDPVFNFINDSLKETPNQIQQTNNQLEKINGQILKEIQLQNTNDQFNDHVQIRSFVQLNEQFVAFCSNLKQIHLLSLQDFKVLQVLEEECDVITLGKCRIQNQMHLVSATEDTNGYSLGVWNLESLQKIIEFTAHTQHIWTICQLTGSQLATCSEDQLIKIWDMEKKSCTQEFMPHQGGINDIALVNNQLLVSVSEDQTLALTDFESGKQEGFQVQECEIKCVVALDGEILVTGDSNGYITIYTIKLEMVRRLKIHKALIRNIVRINSKTIATASWDGSHIFYSVENDKVIKQVEGPRKNFSEGIIWIQDYLLAGSGGKIKIYK